MSLAASAAQLQDHLNAYANEIVALLGGRKSAAPKARKHLQMLKELSARLRVEVLDHTKPEKKTDTAVTVTATLQHNTEEMAAAAEALVELAPSPPKDTIPSPKPKRVRKAPAKKSI